MYAKKKKKEFILEYEGKRPQKAAWKEKNLSRSAEEEAYSRPVSTSTFLMRSQQSDELANRGQVSASHDLHIS
jgi:hypothetical protein